MVNWPYQLDTDNSSSITFWGSNYYNAAIQAVQITHKGCSANSQNVRAKTEENGEKRRKSERKFEILG